VRSSFPLAPKDGATYLQQCESRFC
jgi:hypothetical protein